MWMKYKKKTEYEARAVFTCIGNRLLCFLGGKCTITKFYIKLQWSSSENDFKKWKYFFQHAPQPALIQNFISNPRKWSCLFVSHGLVLTSMEKLSLSEINIAWIYLYHLFLWLTSIIECFQLICNYIISGCWTQDWFTTLIYQFRGVMKLWNSEIIEANVFFSLLSFMIIRNNFLQLIIFLN